MYTYVYYTIPHTYTYMYIYITYVNFIIYLHKSKPQVGHLASHRPGRTWWSQPCAPCRRHSSWWGRSRCAAGLLVVPWGREFTMISPWFATEKCGVGWFASGESARNIGPLVVAILVDSMHVLIVDVPSFLFPPKWVTKESKKRHS